MKIDTWLYIDAQFLKSVHSMKWYFIGALHQSSAKTLVKCTPHTNILERFTKVGQNIKHKIK